MDKDEIIKELESRAESIRRDLKSNYYENLEEGRFLDGYYKRVEQEIEFLRGLLKKSKGNSSR